MKEKKLQMNKQLKSEGNVYNDSQIRKKRVQEKKSFLIHEENKYTDIPHQSTIKPMYIKMKTHHKHKITDNNCVSHKDSPIFNKIRCIYNELSTNASSSKINSISS